MLQVVHTNYIYIMLAEHCYFAVMSFVVMLPSLFAQSLPQARIDLESNWACIFNTTSVV